MKSTTDNDENPFPLIDTSRSTPTGLPKRLKRRMWFGLGCLAFGIPPFLVGYYYLTSLWRYQEFRTPILSNIMGACFWGGLILAFIGMVLLFSLLDRLLGRR